MLQRLAIATIVLAIVGWGASLTLDRLPDSLWPWSRAVDAELDEGWRRTNAGWERLTPSVLTTPAFHVRTAVVVVAGKEPSATRTPDPRWDFHPAFLALLLLLGATSAFCLFPNEASRATCLASQSLF